MASAKQQETWMQVMPTNAKGEIKIAQEGIRLD